MTTRSYLLLLGVLAVLDIAAAALMLPPFIQPCSRNDPEINKCAVEHGRIALPYVLKGSPQINIPPLDPLFIPEVTVERTGNVGAVFINRDINITGLNGLIIDGCDLDLKKRYIQGWYSLPRLEINSKYEIKGRILVLPIEGKGDSNLTLVGNKLHQWFTYDLVDRDGETFMVMKDDDLIINATQAYFNLTNLFNGNKALGDNMNKFLNENWNEVLQEIGPDIIVAVRKVMEALVTAVMKSFTYDSMFPDKI